jgi:hypothetical protein
VHPRTRHALRHAAVLTGEATALWLILTVIWPAAAVLIALAAWSIATALSAFARRHRLTLTGALIAAVLYLAARRTATDGTDRHDPNGTP